MLVSILITDKTNFSRRRRTAIFSFAFFLTSVHQIFYSIYLLRPYSTPAFLYIITLPRFPPSKNVDALSFRSFSHSRIRYENEQRHTYIHIERERFKTQFSDKIGKGCRWEMGLGCIFLHIFNFVLYVWISKLAHSPIPISCFLMFFEDFPHPYYYYF